MDKKKINSLFSKLNSEKFRQNATEAELQEIEKLIDNLNLIKKSYWISTFKPQVKQDMLLQKIKEAVFWESKKLYHVFWWWNRWWKSIICVFICALLALWREWEKYWLPFIGHKKKIYVYTKTWQNLKDVMLPYFIGDYSLVWIPDEEVEKTVVDRGRIKEIVLKNWAKINFLTYDQRRENIQWGTPDFIWCDEEPTDQWVWDEIYARSTSEWCHTLISMTPLWEMSWLYKQLIDNDDKDWQKKFVYEIQVFWVLDNEYSNKDWIWGWTEEQKNRRIYWAWNPPDGLVYGNFSPKNMLTNEGNMKIHVEPTFEEMWEPVRYYYGIDPWGAHPHALSWLCRTESGIWYQFYEKKFDRNEPVAVVAEEIKRLTRKYPATTIICDSQAKAYRRELEYHWIKTEKAQKRRKYKDTENRETGIRLINTLFLEWNFYISWRCVETEKEYKTHYYKLWRNWFNGDWGVRKINDDLIDSIRYVITQIEIWNKDKENPKLNLANMSKKDRSMMMKWYWKYTHWTYYEYNT